jgi:predicted phosphodiesterase
MERNMKIAVISDIHGHRLALETALTAIRKETPDQIVCLGDAVQGGPQPKEVVAILRDLACPVVMGNADAWLLSGDETGSEDISPERRVRLDETRLWSLSQLSEADRTFIAAFQPTITVALPNGQNLLGFHGSPVSFDEVLLPWTSQEQFQQILGEYSTDILCGGHTHVQYIRRMKDSFFFNPGSIGVTYNHDQNDEANFRLNPWIEYAILIVEATNLSLAFQRIPLDVEQERQVYLNSGIPFVTQYLEQYQGL